MKVNGVDFNVSYVAGLEKEYFVNMPSFAHFWPELKTVEERKLRLEQVWTMCKDDKVISCFSETTHVNLAEPFTQEQANRNWKKILEKLSEEDTATPSDLAFQLPARNIVYMTISKSEGTKTSGNSIQLEATGSPLQVTIPAVEEIPEGSRISITNIKDEDIHIYGRGEVIILPAGKTYHDRINADIIKSRISELMENEKLTIEEATEQANGEWADQMDRNIQHDGQNADTDPE